MTDILKMSRDEVVTRLKALAEQDMHRLEQGELPEDLAQHINQHMQLMMRAAELLGAQVG